MDSDASADAEYESESPKKRSWVSSNSDHQSSPGSPTKNSDNGSSSSDGESSPNAKDESSSDRESSPEAKDSDGSDQESSSDVKDTAGSQDSSPDIKHTAASDHPSSPETKGNDSDHESSPEKEVASDRESSPERNTDKDESPNLKNVSSPPTGVTSPENGVWPSSPSEKPSSPATPASPSIDDYQQKADKNKEDRIYEHANGNISPKSPKRSNSVGWDSRSEIASSLDSISPSQFERQESENKEIDEKEKHSNNKKALIDFADDLSDVSDIESNDSFDTGEKIHAKKVGSPIPEERTEVAEKQIEDAVSLHVEGEEQLDFEAEEGECSPSKIDENKKKEEAKIEKEQSDLEEGELTDDNDTKPEETERPVCRFFSRGHCTWGSNCRFIHPGVMDKGNYSMFETVRPIITPGAPPPPNSATPIMYPVFPPHLPHSHLAERPGVVPPSGSGPRKDETPLESAWERGLRQAKEMIRKSSKRKETEVDFEDKKMNLTLSQDEIDKENDYYSRHSGSPVKSPSSDKWKLDPEVKSHRDPYPNDLPPPVPHGGADVPQMGYYPPLHHGMSRPDYWGPHRMSGMPYDEYGLRPPHLSYGPDFYSAAAGRRYMHPNSYYPPRPGNVSAPPSHHPDFYDRKQKHKQYPGSSREVIVQKNDKPYKDDSPSRYRNRREDSPRVERIRDDEWADPWMRTKSPAGGRRRRRKDTYSSGSSYSSSSESSRSSSRSSFSSKSRHSRSRSKAHSSGSRSHSSSRSAPESQSRKKPPMQFKLSPSSRSQLPIPKKTPKSISPTLLSERRAATERAMHMNPPPPSPKIKTRPHSPPVPNAIGSLSSTSPPRNKGGLPDRLLAHSKAAVVAAMRSTRSSESQSSKSSSGSSSSDSSSDSSDSSASSSSTSKSKTPPSKFVRPPKRSVAEDHVNTSQTVKNKAMDALKLSGQKQQIKLTLKGSSNASQSKRASAVDNTDARKDRQITSKKRVAESSDSGSDSDRASPAKKTSKLNPKKGAPSRREELLKQLKAVEDAIARKRSKIP